MAKTARFLYIKQSPVTLSGPYILHARKPHCILEMQKANNYIHSATSKVASFKIISQIEPVDEDLQIQIESQADKWYFSQVSQKLIDP